MNAVALTPGRPLVALETSEQVAAWLARDATNALVVALSAEADEILDHHGIMHATIEDFYSEAALMRGAAGNNAVTEAICTALDRLLGIEIGKTLPEFSAFYHRGRIRILHDALQRAAFSLGAMLDAAKPSAVTVGAASAFDASGIWIRDRCFLSFALIHIARARGLAVNVLPAGTTPRTANVNFKAAILGYLRSFRDQLRSLSFQRGHVAFFFWPDKPEAELEFAKVRAVRLPAARPSTQRSATPPLDSLSQFYVFGRDSLFELARPHLAALVGKFRAECVAHLGLVEKMFRRAHVRAGVATAPLNIEAINTLLAARRANRPAVVLQHGGFNGYADFTILPFSEFGLNDHYLCYGQGVADGVTQEAQAISAIRDRAVHSVAIGSPTVQDVYRSRAALKPERAKPRAIYVPTILTGSSRYLAGHVRADIAYWRQQREVLKLLMARQDWEVDFRPPALNFIGSPALLWLERQKSHGIRIRTDRSFRDLLLEENYDLIVTDAVATVLIESLATDARIITQFDAATMQLRAEAKALLERRARVSFSTEAFLTDIAAALDVKHNNEEIDDGFLRRYALPSDLDSRKAQAEAIRTIAGGGASALH